METCVNTEQYPLVQGQLISAESFPTMVEVKVSKQRGSSGRNWNELDAEMHFLSVRDTLHCCKHVMLHTNFFES